MQKPATPSIDHLLVLVAVVEAGGFTAAAKRLGRAISAISYAIDTLEQQLGVALFDRGTTRKPRLTRQGEAIVSEARAVAQSVDALRARVKGLLDDLEPELSLVVDSLFPSDRLVALLREFHAEFPTVPVRLLVETLGGVERVIRSGAAAIGIGSRVHMDAQGLRRFEITGVQMIPVRRAQSPACRGGRGRHIAATRLRSAHSFGPTRGRGSRFCYCEPRYLARRRYHGKAQAPPCRDRLGWNAGADGAR